MKQYLKMADVFDCEVESDADLMFSDSLGNIADFSGYKTQCRYSAHAINSHDELVQMLAVMTELVGKMNCYCHQAGSSAKANSENPVESWMAEADEALDAIRSAA